MKKLLLLLIVSLSYCATGLAQGTNHALKVYITEDNICEIFPSTVIDSIRYNKYDYDGMPHQNYVMQEIYTQDSTYQVMFSELDSMKTADYSYTPGEKVDLGLSVKWANYNLGAAKPEDFGGLYGWADTTGNKIIVDYNQYPNENPISDICGTEYDIATAKWGSDWRLPTEEEVKELINDCKFEFVEVNGVKGGKYTGPNGKSIFLPAAGLRTGVDNKFINKNGMSWTGTLEDQMVFASYALTLRDGNTNSTFFFRDYGFSVRPVSDK